MAEGSCRELGVVAVERRAWVVGRWEWEEVALKGLEVGRVSC